eukprot:1886-Eustigmatos_ZCMA.PRE.1
MHDDQIKASAGGYVGSGGSVSSNVRSAAGPVRDDGAAEPATAMDLGEDPKQHIEGNKRGM